MGIMGLFLFITMAVIYIHGKEGSLSPLAKDIFLHYMARMLLLGDLTKEKQANMGTGIGEETLTNQPAVEMTNSAFEDMSAEDRERGAEIWFRSSGHPEMSSQTSKPGSPGFSRLDELTMAVKRGTEELTKAVKIGTERMAGELAEMKNELTGRMTEMKNELTGGMTDVKNELTGGMADIKSKLEELTKAVKNEEEVSDYTLLAKVLDRLCLFMYVISIVAAIPMTMYLSR
ncbi:uncharacterized protein LOC144864973 [Branchiostoma floridae x Branchiostoma japonicum]